MAIVRTTPVLPGLFPLVTLLAQRLHARGLLRIQTCAWYQEATPTFSGTPLSIGRDYF